MAITSGRRDRQTDREPHREPLFNRERTPPPGHREPLFIVVERCSASDINTLRDRVCRAEDVDAENCRWKTHTERSGGEVRSFGVSNGADRSHLVVTGKRDR